MGRKPYKKITFEDRLVIEKMTREPGMDATSIAAAIGVHYNTILRELKRGGDPYNAEVAQRTI